MLEKINAAYKVLQFIGSVVLGMVTCALSICLIIIALQFIAKNNSELRDNFIGKIHSGKKVNQIAKI